MRFDSKRLFLKYGLIFALIEFLLYIPVHISYMDFFADAGTGFQTFWGILISLTSEVALFALPVFGALLLFIYYVYNGFARTLPRVFAFSLPYAIGSIPENYLVYLKMFDSEGALFFSAVLTLGIILIVTVQMLALFGIICFFVKLPREAERFSKKAVGIIECEDYTDFSKPFAKGLFAATFVQFLITFIPEAVSTVEYIIEKSGTYRTNEIVTIVLTLFFIIAELVFVYIFAYKFKNRLLDERLYEIKNPSSGDKKKEK